MTPWSGNAGWSAVFQASSVNCEEVQRASCALNPAKGGLNRQCYYWWAAYFLGRSKEDRQLNSSHNKVGPSSDSADGRYYKHQKNTHPKARLVHNASIAFCIGS
jgi:hypothetical protein